MPDPDPVPVPASTLTRMLRLVREGQAPLIAWNESRQKMDDAASRRRSEIFTELEEELEPFIAD